MDRLKVPHCMTPAYALRLLDTCLPAIKCTQAHEADSFRHAGTHFGLLRGAARGSMGLGFRASLIVE